MLEIENNTKNKEDEIPHTTTTWIFYALQCHKNLYNVASCQQHKFLHDMTKTLKAWKVYQPHVRERKHTMHKLTHKDCSKNFQFTLALQCHTIVFDVSSIIWRRQVAIAIECRGGRHLRGGKPMKKLHHTNEYKVNIKSFNTSQILIYFMKCYSSV